MTISVLAGLFLSACTMSPTVVTANSTPAVQASDIPPVSELIDVGITPFEPNIPETEEELEKAIIIPDVRRAESNYFAYHLKDTLESTGNWGAVRVTPVQSFAVDVVINGKILESDGEMLEVEVTAVDSTGRTWIDDKYEDNASRFSYRNQGREDPFQDLYNQIANDLLAVQQQLPAEELKRIRRTSSLRFAASFAPQAFDDYITEGRGDRLEIVRLPSEQDPMLARIDRIKEREYLVVDTLDEFYGKFYKEMQPSYFLWRESTYEEGVALRRARKEANMRMLGGAALIAGGIMAGKNSGTRAGQTAGAVGISSGYLAIRSGMRKRQQAEIHEAALKETSESLGAEITPIVLDIEGKSVELTGSAAAQYEQWREILKEIYREETGI